MHKKPYTFIYQVPLEMEFQWVSMIFLLKRWSWKGFFSITLGRVFMLRSPWPQILWGDNFTQKMVLKDHIWWHRGSLCTFIVQVPWETELWVDMIVLVKNGLERPFVNNTRKGFALHVHCSILPVDRTQKKLLHIHSGLPGQQTHWVDTIVLLTRWFWKGFLSVTLGTPLHIHCWVSGETAHWIDMICLLIRWSYKGHLLLTIWNLCLFWFFWETELFKLVTLGKPLHIHYSCIPGDRAHWIYMIGLLRRCSFKRHLSLTQGSFCMCLRSPGRQLIKSIW